jgi:hypothetical protein
MTVAPAACATAAVPSRLPLSTTITSCTSSREIARTTLPIAASSSRAGIIVTMRMGRGPSSVPGLHAEGTGPAAAGPLYPVASKPPNACLACGGLGKPVVQEQIHPDIATRMAEGKDEMWSDEEGPNPAPFPRVMRNYLVSESHGRLFTLVCARNALPLVLSGAAPRRAHPSPTLGEVRRAR